jgi:hypothetical protein
VICPTDEYDGGLADVAAQLVESCLVLGGDAPELAERLFAWRAIGDDPAQAASRRPDDAGHPDTVALLAVLLLRAVAGSVSAPRWRDLFVQVLTPQVSTRADLAGLLDTLRPRHT